MKIAILNDTHRGVRNSSPVFAEHQWRFYSDVFFPYLDRHDITTILHLGDYFDNRRTISVKCLNDDREQFIQPCLERDMEVVILCGNHDVTYKNTNTYNSLAPYLMNVPGFSVIENARHMIFDSLPILVVPWLNSENLAESMKYMSASRAKICVGHFEFSGFDMYKGVPAHGGFNADALKNFKMVLSGHYHTKSTKGNVTYLGSQMEFTWSDWNDDKFFHVLDTDTLQLDAIKNPHRIHEKIFYDDVDNTYDDELAQDYEDKFVKVIEKRVTKRDKYESFLAALTEYGALDVRAMQPLDDTLETADEKRTTDVTDTQTLIEEYIDDLGVELDKTRLKKMMRKLYTDAVISAENQ